MKKPLTVIEFAKMGAKARWKDKTKEERKAHSKMMNSFRKKKNAITS